MRSEDTEMNDCKHMLIRAFRSNYKRISPFKAPRPDELYPVLLQKSWNQLKGYYHVIFQACLGHSYVPWAWNVGTSIFLPKPGKESYFEAKPFRIFTLTSFQLKWLERLILYHINEGNNVQAELSASLSDFAQVFLRKLLCMNLYTVWRIDLLRKKLTRLQMPADQIKKTKVFERNFESQIMDKKNVIRSESVLNQNTVKAYTDGSKPDGRVGAGFYAENPNNSRNRHFSPWNTQHCVPGRSLN